MPPKGRTGKDFQTKDLKDHILDIPDTYVGSTDPKMKSEWVFDFEEKRMKMVELDLPEAVKRITLEIISNAGDNAYFSRTEGVNPGRIEMNWDDEGYLSIKNGGLPVPVEPHERSTDKDLYLVPTDVFSVPLTSTNYDVNKDRLGCGRNGYGSKLTNSFSQHFVVEIGDADRVDSSGKTISGQEYIGEWKNNMRTLVQARASPGFELKNGKWERIKKLEYAGSAYVKVSWLLDFKRMHMNRQKYTQDELGLFARYMIEFSLTCGVPISINGEEFDFRSIRKFASIFFPPSLMETAVTHFCTSKDKPFPKKYENIKKDTHREEFIYNTGFIPESQILVLDTPDEGQTFSYVNGLITAEGGVHVDALHKELFGNIVKQMNDKFKGVTRLNTKDVKPHVTVFLICRVPNAKYNSQSKTKLENPVPTIKFESNHYKKILSDDWRLTERLKNTIGAKNVKGLSKSDGKKTALVDVPNLVDANEAGKSKSGMCTLYIVEGKSAASYPKKRIQLSEGGKDLNGYYPIQGKLMNVLTHKAEAIAAYKEFENIKKALGLRQDTDYTQESNFKTLRYGRVIITTDADSDGMHILGLIINLFHSFWPSLFKRSYIRQLVTPVVRVFGKGKKVHRFYDENSFLKWFEKNGSTVKKGDISYYKGLGSSEDTDIKDDMTTAPTMIIINDDKGDDLINLAFDKTRSHDRKKWIQEWREIRNSITPFEPKGLLESRPTSEIMGVSFPPYMIDNLVRSIPSIYDGLKKSQRQVLYYGLHHYNYGKKYSEELKKGDKMVGFASGVIDFSKYHHGDASLFDTVMKMTRDYCGSNNMAIFRGKGQFGTRDGGGKDAANPRYVELSCPWWMSYVFNQDMVDLVPRRDVDGELAEPLWIPCDIPLGVINGTTGIATGWSTYIPLHHPLEVTNWILDRLAGKKRIDPLNPYFHGFNGMIEVKVKTPAPKSSKKDELESVDSSNIEDDEEYIPEFHKGRGFITKGSFRIRKEYSNSNKVDIVIYEIPITTATSEYMKFIRGLVEDGKARDVRDTSGTETVHIEVFGLDGTYANLEKLKLEKGLPLTNMVLVDNDGIPKKYDSTETIMARYVDEMIQMYSQYKAHVIKKDNEKLELLNMELAIVIAYLEKKLIVHHKTDTEINDQLKALKLDQKVFDRINLRQLSKNRVEQLKKKIDELTKAIAEFSKKSVETLWSDRLKAFKKEFIRRKVYETPLEDAINIIESSNMIIGGELSYKKAIISYES